jgi:hypothetical protein
MPKNTLADLLDKQPTEKSLADHTVTKKSGKRKQQAARIVHKPGDKNISAYFPPEVKAALRHVQAKTGKNIKGCLAEALQMLFRKHNVAVTVSEE